MQLAAQGWTTFIRLRAVATFAWYIEGHVSKIGGDWRIWEEVS